MIRQSIRICTDRIVPAAPRRAVHPIAAERDKLWKPGQTLGVHFLDGGAAQHCKVEAIARQWEQCCSIHFRFTSETNAEIRISFAPPGSWSAIGTDCLSPYFAREPTMNFGWLTAATSAEESSRVVLHEFGHALGAVHEHQNPAGGIQWNTEAVYRYFSSEPNRWTKEEIDRNVLERYTRDSTNFTAFDPDSIMLYDYPPDLTLDGARTHSNHCLSASDKEFMRRQYP